jgi:pentatricopeptide repeat protein
METILEADKVDEASFNILIKGLVEAHAPDKARDLLVNMRTWAFLIESLSNCPAGQPATVPSIGGSMMR